MAVVRPLVLVFGGRQYRNRAVLWTVLDNLEDRPGTILHGGCRGADRIAGEWARERGVPECVVAADWETYGRAAGPIRNRQMAAIWR